MSVPAIRTVGVTVAWIDDVVKVKMNLDVERPVGEERVVYVTMPRDVDQTEVEIIARGIAALIHSGAAPDDSAADDDVSTKVVH